MTTYATIRKCCEDEDQNAFPPPLIGFDTKLIDWNHERLICFQPDELDNEEFNLILYCPVRKVVFLSRSMFFDFS